jgi:hypothetical protein
MPTREDIIKQLSIISQYCERPDVEMAIDEVIASIAGIRCETCTMYEMPYGWCNAFDLAIGKDFGCFSHEAK